MPLLRILCTPAVRGGLGRVRSCGGQERTARLRALDGSARIRTSRWASLMAVLERREPSTKSAIKKEGTVQTCCFVTAIRFGRFGS